MAKSRAEAELKVKRVEVKIDRAMWERAMRACERKGITLSHIVRRGLAWALPIVERDPQTGVPEEMNQRAPRPELKAWEPSARAVRSRDPF
jgi:hypothetical protein